jgi:hypothetical protein
VPRSLAHAGSRRFLPRPQQSPYTLHPCHRALVDGALEKLSTDRRGCVVDLGDGVDAPPRPRGVSIFGRLAAVPPPIERATFTIIDVGLSDSCFVPSMFAALHPARRALRLLGRATWSSRGCVPHLVRLVANPATDGAYQDGHGLCTSLDMAAGMPTVLHATAVSVRVPLSALSPPSCRACGPRRDTGAGTMVSLANSAATGPTRLQPPGTHWHAASGLRRRGSLQRPKLPCRVSLRQTAAFSWSFSPRQYRSRRVHRYRWSRSCRSPKSQRGLFQRTRTLAPSVTRASRDRTAQQLSCEPRGACCAGDGRHSGGPLDRE